jgi:hypothetical protein
MGCCTTSGSQGVGQVTLLHIPSGIIKWFGFESFPTPTTTSGNTFAAGTHIVWIDRLALVDIEVAGADTIRIDNTSSSTQTGNVTLIW